MESAHVTINTSRRERWSKEPGTQETCGQVEIFGGPQLTSQLALEHSQCSCKSKIFVKIDGTVIKKH